MARGLISGLLGAIQGIEEFNAEKKAEAVLAGERALEERKQTRLENDLSFRRKQAELSRKLKERELDASAAKAQREANEKKLKANLALYKNQAGSLEKEISMVDEEIKAMMEKEKIGELDDKGSFQLKQLRDQRDAITDKLIDSRGNAIFFYTQLATGDHTQSLKMREEYLNVAAKERMSGGKVLQLGFSGLLGDGSKKDPPEPKGKNRPPSSVSTPSPTLKRLGEEANKAGQRQFPLQRLLLSKMAEVGVDDIKNFVSPVTDFFLSGNRDLEEDFKKKRERGLDVEVFQQ